MTFEQFVDNWQERHALYVNHLPKLRRYIQSPAMPHPRRTCSWDGMAQLWFDDMRAINLAFESPEADRMRDDEKNFIGDQEWFIATDHPIID